MSDSEFDGDSDQEVSENHSNLIDSVRQLDKGHSRNKRLERNEPTLQVSDFGQVKSGVSDYDLVENDVSSSKSKSKVLPKPLEKTAAERIQRTVAYDNLRKDLGKWAGTIARNRTARSVSFPLETVEEKKKTSYTPWLDFRRHPKLMTDLEKKLAELEALPEPEEEKEEFPLTADEILERRKETAKFRAQQSYKIAKAHRQNKIKSKKFHRIQKKDKIRKTLKEFEELQKTDPQAALEKLEELDKTRAEERMTLRHKSTGQWAQSKLIRAKYDKESRQVLAEQLAISRELTQKLKKNESDEDDEDVEEPTNVNLPASDKENPWLKATKTDNEIDEFISGYRKFWEEKNKENENENQSENSEKEVQIKNTKVQVMEECLPKKNDVSKSKKNQLSSKKPKNKVLEVEEPTVKAEKPKVQEPTIKAGTSTWSVSPVNSSTNNSTSVNDIDIDNMFDSVEENIQEKINKKLAKVRQMLEKEEKKEDKRKKKKAAQTTEKEVDYSENDLEKLALKEQRPLNPVKSKPEINPNTFMNMKVKHIKTSLPDDVGGEDVALDDNEIAEDQHQIISEAFADDDVVEEFQKEKEEEIQKSQPKEVDNRLPGWGSWTGAGITPSKRKSRSFVKNVPKKVPRRPENEGNVVIFEQKNAAIKNHQVKSVPFPFKTVSDFEASLRAPLSREFVPETVYQTLIEPPVKTKLGTIIKPMSEDDLVNIKKTKQRKRIKINSGKENEKKREKIKSLTE